MKKASRGFSVTAALVSNRNSSNGAKANRLYTNCNYFSVSNGFCKFCLRHVIYPKVRYMQEVQRQRLQGGNQPSTAVCHLAMSFVQWLLRRLVRWRMMHKHFSWQRLAEEQRSAQLICRKACSYISGFLWQIQRFNAVCLTNSLTVSEYSS